MSHEFASIDVSNAQGRLQRTNMTRVKYMRKAYLSKTRRGNAEDATCDQFNGAE